MQMIGDKGEVEVMTLCDSVLHCEHIMQSVGPLDAGKFGVNKMKDTKIQNRLTEVFLGPSQLPQPLGTHQTCGCKHP